MPRISSLKRVNLDRVAFAQNPRLEEVLTDLFQWKAKRRHLQQLSGPAAAWVGWGC